MSFNSCGVDWHGFANVNKISSVKRLASFIITDSNTMYFLFCLYYAR